MKASLDSGNTSNDYRIAARRLLERIPSGAALIAHRLRDAGAAVYIVGGVVRDAILGRDGHDWDIATDFQPKRVRALFDRVIPVGEGFGTVLVQEDGENVEVTTFRTEGTYSDGRHPSEVTFIATIEGDLARRDFTMNAIAFDPLTQRWVDPYGGAADIAARQIRAVGDPRERFREDGLRPMRALRFVATLGFGVEEQTKHALGDELESFRAVAWERKWHELSRLLSGDHVVDALRLFADSGLLLECFPELVPNDTGGDELDLLPKLAADPGLRWIGWMAVRGIEATESAVLADRLRLSRLLRQRMGRALGAYGQFGRKPVTGAKLRRLLASWGPTAIADAVAVSSAQEPELEAWSRRVSRWLRRPPPYRINDLAVSGADLVALGFEGRRVGAVQRHLLDVVLDAPDRNRKGTLITIAQELPR